VPKSQVWIADTLESSVNYPDLSDPEFMSMFDIELSYRKSADIWRSYVGHDFDVRIKGAAPGRKRRRFCCAFVSSGFHESGRRDLMKNLMDRLPVHSYGKLFRNRRLWFDKGIPSKLKALEKYTYTLALENSIDQDYVTEKFFEPLMTGTIPIYLGAPNIDDFAPGENCFINVNDFASVDALADFLKTADPAQFHAWRDKPLSPQFLAIVEEMRWPFESRLANLIRQKRAEKSPSPS
ncbi:MAG: glycosyltransferase family 10, partial [Pseudomonadota bacterium]